MANKRKNIPKKIKRDLMNEAGWRCAVPTCRVSFPLEEAHIVPVEKDGDNSFHNLIILCRNCHWMYDKAKPGAMSRQALIKLKSNLMVLNGRYSPFEIRILESFLANPGKVEIPLHDREIDVMYLVKDGLIRDDGARRANSINLPSKNYILTTEGRAFIERWKQAKDLDESGT